MRETRVPMSVSRFMGASALAVIVTASTVAGQAGPCQPTADQRPQGRYA